MNLGVFLPNWVGDAVMATPALRALRRRFSDDRIVAIGRPHILQLLEGLNTFGAEIPFDPRGASRDHRGWGFYRILRRERLDSVVLLTNSWRTAAWAWASGARDRTGFAKDGRSWLLTRRLDLPRERGRLVPFSALDAYSRLASVMGCPPEPPKMRLTVSPADEEQADRFWSRAGLPSNGGVVALNTGGAFGSAKAWPSEYFAQLAKRLVQERGQWVLVLCGPAEREAAREITREADLPQVVSLADERLSIGLSKACLRRSGLLITTDSGPRHIAAAFGVPTVTLFGPTHTAWSENHFAEDTHLQLALECSPCQKRTCPLKHHKCMRDLKVDHVFDAATTRLDALRTRAA